MDDDDLRRALSAPGRAEDNVSAGVEAAMRTTRRRWNWLRWLAALAIVAVTGTILLFGYAAGAVVLPRMDAGFAAGLLWFPLGLTAALVVTTAALALVAVGRGA